MDFFGIGPPEILLILLLAFIIFGPKKLFELSRNAGKTMRELSHHVSDLNVKLMDEIEGKKTTPRDNSTDDNLR